VQPDAHADGPIGQRLLDGQGGGERVRCLCEDDEEGVSLGIHLEAAVRSPGLPAAAMVLTQGLCIGLVSDLPQEFGRALDVAEEEGDGAGRELGPHAPACANERERSSQPSDPWRVRSPRGPPQYIFDDGTLHGRRGRNSLKSDVFG
jgi:hypothetical protein